MQEHQILFVDDDEVILSMVERYLTREGYRVSLVNSGHRALELLKEKNFDIVFTDFKMPEIDGIELLSAIKEYRPQTEVIIVTGHGTLETAVQAMKIGSYDYLQKPFKLDLLKLIIDRILEEKRLKQARALLKTRVKERHRYDELIGLSLVMQEIYEIIDRMKHAGPNVLIQGESGTGKELTARIVHRHSDRSQRQLLPITCRALTLEANAKGRSAEIDRLLAACNGGTLYLDEITEIAPSVQAELLTGIRRESGNGDNRRPGSRDLRVIAATNRDIREALEGDLVRRDFLNFVNAVSIQLPPLRERKEDICLLIHHFLQKHNSQRRRKLYSTTPEALDYLLRYHWPGNVIQLENVIERAFALGAETLIDVADLPEDIKTFGDLSKH